MGSRVIVMILMLIFILMSLIIIALASATTLIPLTATLVASSSTSSLSLMLIWSIRVVLLLIILGRGLGGWVWFLLICWKIPVRRVRELLLVARLINGLTTRRTGRLLTLKILVIVLLLQLSLIIWHGWIKVVLVYYEWLRIEDLGKRSSWFWLWSWFGQRNVVSTFLSVFDIWVMH